MQRLLQLLLILGIGQAVWPASIFELPDLTRRIPERSSTPGCAYKGDRYTHGDQVATLEPCLNCTCIRAVVVCYLRVCPSAPTPPPGCFLAREVGQCCPTLECGGGKPKEPEEDDSTKVPELRPTFQPEPDTTTPAPEENSLVFVSSTTPYDDSEFLNDIPGGCLVNGTLYGDGSAMLSSSFCEYCFCIRGKTTCLKPKCDLFIEGCTPMYDSNFTCCPSRYECYKKTTMLETAIITESIPVSLTTAKYETTVYDAFADCVLDNTVYHQGEEVENYRSCQSCFCNNASITCEQIKCSPPIAGCQPIIPEGHCCPVSYKCDNHGNTVNYNTKGANLNNSNLLIETKKTNIKTVKQSELFKNNHSPNAESNSKIPPISTDLSSFFNNLVPQPKHSGESIAELYLSSDELNSGEVISDIPANNTFENVTQTKSWRENDKTLNLSLQDETTPFHLENDEELQSKQTTLAKESKSDNETTPEIIMGIPEEKTILVRDILNDYFFSKNNYSTLVTRASFEGKRNNSKHASNIGETKETTSPLRLFTTEETITSDNAINVSDVTENNVPSTTPSPQENHNPFTVAMNVPLNLQDDGESPISIQTTFGFLSTSTLEDEKITGPNSSPQTTAADILSTLSNTALTEALIEHFSPKEYETTLEEEPSPTSSTSTSEIEPTKIMKSSTRINSKQRLPSHKETSESFSDESLTDFYLPALGRAENDDDDFTNVGAIHLGAPLSVSSTETRRDPINLRNKITESGGIIFMDPKYTDIHPNEESTQNHPKSTEINPIKDGASPEITDNPTPIRRSDTDYTKHTQDLKKGPRIQDVYNHTSVGQDFKIIPFVAEDAIRGLHGKVKLVPVDDSTQGPPDLVSDFCFVRGRIYKNGEVINKPDPCEICRCFYGQELCQLQRCPSPPPGCLPEKLPNYCCPRYTCEKLPADSQVLTSRPGVVTNIISILPPPTTQKAKVTQNIQSSSTTTRAPEPLRTSEKPSEESTRITSSLFTGITRNSFNRLSTTRQPDTTKASNSHFLDPWGLLQVSGCNIYGKFFNINDQVEILSGPCSHCICTVNGVECNDIC